MEQFWIQGTERNENEFQHNFFLEIQIFILYFSKMFPFHQNEVLIACTCGAIKPLTNIYFCRYCVVLRCSYCVSHEVDSHYCSNCLENLATTEAKLKNNRCGTCFECPVCFHSLGIRARFLKTAEEEGQSGTPNKSKLYYLMCFSCRWTSREARIPDQTTATSNNWPKRDNPWSPRIAELIEFYKILCLKDRLERENRTFAYPAKGEYQHFSALSGVLARKRAGLPGFPLLRGTDDLKLPPMLPSVSEERVEPLNLEQVFSDVTLETTTTLKQRFQIPHSQPVRTEDLFPVHRKLFVKRSQRCRTCSHNIFKPEYTAASIKFKIHLAAYYLVPSVKLTKLANFRKGETSTISLKISNPAQADTVISILPATTPIPPPPLEDANSPKDESRTISITGNMDIPEGGICVKLPGKDDSAEYGEQIRNIPLEGDNGMVTWRRGNKLGLNVEITPSEGLECGERVVVSFLLTYTYRDKLVSSLEQKECKDVFVYAKHFLMAGKVE